MAENEEGILTEIGDAVEKELSVNYGRRSGPIYYPLTLQSQMEKGREYMRLRIISGDMDEKKSIYLLTPAGLSVPDGASWNAVDLGTLVGGGAAVAARGTAALKSLGTWDGAMAGIEDIVAASTLTALDKFGGILGAPALMTAGIAANPYTNTQFTGTSLRTFEFTFKLISENKTESLIAKQIENTFRKFLYPRTHPKSQMVLVYPPLWDIGFYKDAEVEGSMKAVRNKFMPRLHLCNMTSLNVVYNATGNSFHTDGSPTEMDISLGFQETKSLTRDDLYGKTADSGPDYGHSEKDDYDDDRFWPTLKQTDIL